MASVGKDPDSLMLLLIDVQKRLAWPLRITLRSNPGSATLICGVFEMRGAMWVDSGRLKSWGGGTV